MQRNNDNNLRSVFGFLGIPDEVYSVYQSSFLSAQSGKNHNKHEELRLFHWQRECLYSTSALRGGNLVYCVPTGGGKTLVAELVILKTVLQLKKQAIYVMPYVSLVQEKEKQLKGIFRTLNRQKHPQDRIRVKGYYGGVINKDRKKKMYSENLLICTVERANMILNSILLSLSSGGSLLAKKGESHVDGLNLGCVVLDELHVLGNSFNGYLLEIFISKIRYYESSHKEAVTADVRSSIPTNSIKIQLVGLSATMGNVHQLSQWLSAELFVSDFRPVPLLEHIVAGNQLIAMDKTGQVIAEKSLSKHDVSTVTTTGTRKSSFVDSDHVVALTAQALQKGQQVLIFCPTKASCAQTCKLLCEHIQEFLQSPATRFKRKCDNLTPSEPSAPSFIISHSFALSPQQQIEARKGAVRSLLALEKGAANAPVSSDGKKDSTTSSSTGLDESMSSPLAAAVSAGLAFHHAGLTAEERDIVESCYRKGIISVLAATSTLAAGVNLPAGCVLIRSLNIGKEFLNVVQYRQMCGRAGRAGLSNCGESYLLVKAMERDRALALSRQPMPNVVSQIHPRLDGGNALMKALLEVTGLGLCNSTQSLMEFIRHTLLFCQAPAHSHQPSDGAAAASDQQEIINAANLALEFLSDSGIIEAQAYQTSAQSQASIRLSKLGVAMLKSNLDPDEAIVLYDSLLLAQEGLVLDSWLHLLYLVTPLEHRVYPDLKRLLSLFEKSKQFANVVQAVGIDIPTLYKWQGRPPSPSEVDMCHNAVRLYGLHRHHGTKLTGVNEQNKLKPPSFTSRSLLNREEWKTLSRCKRLYAAMLLDQLLAGRSMDALSKEYSVEPADIETLRWQARMTAAKVQKICAEIGWTTMEKVIGDEVCPYVSVDVPKELQPLLKIPYMTRKVAQVLLDKGVQTPEMFVDLEAQVVANYLKLSIGFEIQDVDDLEDSLEESPESATTTTTTTTLKDSNGRRDVSLKLKNQLQREDDIRLRLITLVKSLIKSAREMLREEYLKKDEEISQCMAAAVDVDSMSLAAHAHAVGTEEDDSTISSAEESDDEDDEEEEDEEALQELEGNANDEIIDENPLSGPVKGFAIPNLPRSNTDARYCMVPVPHTSQGSNHISFPYSYETEYKSSASVYSYEEDMDLTGQVSISATFNSNEVVSDHIKALSLNSITSISVPIVNCDDTNSPKLKYAKIGTDPCRVDSDRPQVPSNSVMNRSSGSDIHTIVLKPLGSSNYNSSAGNSTDKNTHEEYVLSDEELLAMLESLESNGILVPAVDPSGTIVQPYIPVQDPSNKENNPLFSNFDYSAQNQYQGDPKYKASNSENQSAMTRRYTYYPIHDDSGIGNDSFTAMLNQSENISKGFFKSPDGKARDCMGDVCRQDAVEISIRTISAKKRLSDDRAQELISEATGPLQPFLTDEELLLALETLEGSLVQHPAGEAYKAPENFVVDTTYSYCNQPIISSETHKATMVVEDSMNNVVGVCSNETQRVTLSTGQDAASPASIIDKPTVVGDRNTSLSVTREQWRTVSPYLSPFTASKVRTPGKYLYCPYTSQKALGNKTLLDMLRTKYSAISYDMSDPVYSIDVDMHSHEDIKEQPAISKHASDNTHCEEFLQRLATARCVSFELVFRRIPGQMLPQWTKTAGKGKDSSEGLLQCGARLISWSCSKQSCLTCSEADLLILSEEMLRMPLDVQHCRGMFRDPYVMTGASFSFGDSIGYYLPLPIVMPLVFSQEAIAPTSLSAEDRLSKLPQKCREKICKYVGYSTILRKCPALNAYIHSDHYLNGQRRSISNPLLMTSKLWCYTARRALLLEWRRGACMEWRLLADIMADTTITKVALNMKSKIVQLRERDVVVRGPLEDPSIAKALLLQTTPSKVSADIEKVSLNMQTSSSSSLHWQYMNIRDESMKQQALLVQAQRLSSQRCVSVMRAMAQLTQCFSIAQTNSTTTSSHGLLQLYRNIEMPLLYSVADAEFCGVLVDGEFFCRLRQGLRDRQELLEHYFYQLCGKNFNADSHLDVGALKKRLIAEIATAVAADFQNSDAIHPPSCVPASKVKILEPTPTNAWNFDPRAATQSNQQQQQQAKDLMVLAERLVLQHHPVMRLISEWRGMTRVPPLCTSILRSRHFNRVKPVYNTLGTDTGRIILTSPPLQQVPHKCSYLPTKRPSLHEELQAIPDDLHQRRKVIDEMNYNSWRAYHHHHHHSSSYSSNIAGKDDTKDSAIAMEWVKVVRLNPATQGTVEYSTGKLVKISSASIFEPMVSLQEQCANFAADLPATAGDSYYSDFKSLAEIWTGAGHHYPDLTNSSDVAKCGRQRDSNNIRAIRQVIVDFGPTHSDGDGGRCNFYAYPADKVFRLGAGIQLNDAEFDALRDSMQEQGRQWLNSVLMLCDTASGQAGNVVEKLERLCAMPSEELCSPADGVIHLAVRDGLRASDGFVLLAVDYCQIELRLLTHFCADPDLCAAFSNDTDVFVSIAARWNSKPELDISPAERTLTKQVCYALIYGAGPALVAQQAGVSEDAAQKMMEDFLRRYLGVKRFIAQTKAACRRCGYVETLLGRRRYIEHITSESAKERARAERQAVNTICQGSAADLIKLAMINIHHRLEELSAAQCVASAANKRSNLLLFRTRRSLPGGGLYKIMDDVRPVLQIHDELVFEVRKEDVLKVAAVVKESMEQAVDLRVPLKVKLSSGDTWGSLQPLSLPVGDGYGYGDIVITGALLKDNDVDYRGSPSEEVEGGAHSLKPSAEHESIKPARIGYGDRRFAIGSWCHSGELEKAQGTTTSIARDLFGKDE